MWFWWNQSDWMGKLTSQKIEQEFKISREHKKQNKKNGSIVKSDKQNSQSIEIQWGLCWPN